MTDWAALRDIPALYAACLGGAPPRSKRAEGGGALSNGSGTGPSPLAARRAGGRAAVADLFGTAAQAGGEDDVMTSAPAKMPEAHEDPNKLLTGARNENSVLFSLNTLTGKSDRPPAPSNNTEASGLIDIRQLSAQIATVDDSKRRNSRVDDIMNLSGGSYLPTLTAPALVAPPSLDSFSADGSRAKSSLSPSARSRSLIALAAIGGLAVIGVAVVGAVAMTRGKSDDENAAKAAASASAAAALVAATSASASAPAPAAAPPPPSAAASVAERETPPPAPPAAPPPPAAAPPTRVASNPSPQPAAAARAAAPESDQPFNMGEAKARLAAVASAVQHCKKANGPTGTGRVVVVFAPSGAAQTATISSQPFEGTPTGACVAAHFRAVRVPAFGGSPFSVAKSFTIN
jgi:hypothetical protein